jgi:pimeloyl-ACP methyl ester carboxylesterase
MFERICRENGIVARNTKPRSPTSLLTEVVGLPENEIADMRAAANWPERVAYAPTIAREARISDGWQWRPDGFAGIRVPTVLLTGSESTPELAAITSSAAAAIPGARVHVLEGHGHMAVRFAPAVVAEVLRDWLK